MNKEKRTAFVLVSIPSRSDHFIEMITAFSRFEKLILGSLTVPDPSKEKTIFGLVLSADTDEIGAFTGTLGRISDVKLKSAVLPLD